MTISSPGIGSNLDVNGIVTKLMTVERIPLDNLAVQESRQRSKLSAYGSLKSAVAALQAVAQGLATGSSLEIQAVTVSDPTVLAASAGASAAPGSHAIEVSALARAARLVSAGFASTSAIVGSGSLTMTFGTYASGGNTFTPNAAKTPVTIAIPPATNTLEGVRDAINAAGAGVTAAIVNDGSASGNRLVITANDSGVANSLRIAVADDDGVATDTGGLSQLAFDPTGAVGSGKNLSELQAAQNAALTIDGIVVTKSSNVITDAIEGVTLNLAKTNVGAPATVTIARDSSKIQASLEAFVKAYNDASKTIRGFTAYDPTTRTGGVLSGDSAPRSILSQMRSTITAGAASGGAFNSLADIGISFQIDGTVKLDATKLQAAIGSNFGDLIKVFEASATASDSLVAYSGAGVGTKAGTYAVSVSRLAAAGTLTGNASPGLSIVAGVNDRIDISVNGAVQGATLTPGVYASAAALATEIQTRLGSGVAVSAAGGVLRVASTVIGSASTVTNASGNGAVGLFGNTPVSTTGADVAGTINGVAATGVGQNLTGATGDASAGLVIRVTGGATGARGSVTYAAGYGQSMYQITSSILATDGLVISRSDGINSTIKQLTSREEAMQRRLDAIEKRYRAQFTALDVMVSSMQATSSYLTQQLTALTKSTK